jgi:hypothetical protein
MTPLGLRKLGVDILEEGFKIFYRFKEPLPVAARAVVARKLEQIHRVSGGRWLTRSRGYLK